MKDTGKIIRHFFTFSGYVFVLLVNILFYNSSLQAQVRDTAGIIEKLVEEKDTMIRSIPFQRWSQTLEKPIDSFLFRNENSRFTKELHNLIFKETSINENQKPAPTKNTSFAAMDGLVIRNIEFIHVDLFAPTLDDTSFTSDTWFQKGVNATHLDTRSSILKRYLLLKSGDRLDVFLAAENERILRDLSFIMDARFIGQSVEGTDSIDLILITQDKLPVGLELELSKSTLASLGLSHQNMLGFGHQLYTTAYWDVENNPHFGYQVSYAVPNIFGTFVTGKLDYIHKWNQETYKIELSRDFRAISFRNAGGISYENTFATRNLEFLDTVFSRTNLKYVNTDMWFGRLFPLRYNPLNMRSGLFFSGRLNLYESIEMPLVDENYQFPYLDKTLFLVSSGITRQGFRKDNMIYTFGRTEDVPYGHMMEATAGIEKIGNKSRAYFAIGASYASYLRKRAYVYMQGKIGTYFYQGNAEQGVFHLQFKYFSPLYSYNQFQYRSFISLNYLHGIDRYPQEYVSVSNQAGIYGLISRDLKGSHKTVLNFESVLFSPYSLLGFRLAFFGNIDLALLSYENKDFPDSRLYTGLGLGVRLRNDKLVFDTFVLRFAFYPGKPQDAFARYFIADTYPKTRFNDFFPYKPAIIGYQ